MKLRMLLLMILVLIGTTLYAQEDEADFVIPTELAGTIVFAAATGDLVEQDGNLVLTLTNIADTLPTLVSQPVLSASNYDTQILASDWSTAEAEEPLSTEALLNIGDLTLKMTVSTPVYDPGSDGAASLSLVVTIDEITSLDPDLKGDPEAPESFEDGTLFILFDSTFIEQVQAGRLVRLEGSRLTGGVEDCIPGITCR